MDEIAIQELIEAHGEIGFFHGTKEVNLTTIRQNGLQPGDQARTVEHQLVRETWALLANALNIEILALQGDMVGVDPRITGTIAREHAVELGNSIRILTGEFDYQGIAFAGSCYAARGFASEGSEATAACRALYGFALERAPEIAHQVAVNINFARFVLELSNRDAILNEPGVILRLIRNPPAGFFFYPKRREEPVYALPIHPAFNNVTQFGELMFSETIPFECFELVR